MYSSDKETGGVQLCRDTAVPGERRCRCFLCSQRRETKSFSLFGGETFASRVKLARRVELQPYRISPAPSPPPKAGETAGRFLTKCLN